MCRLWITSTLQDYQSMKTWHTLHYHFLKAGDGRAYVDKEGWMADIFFFGCEELSFLGEELRKVVLNRSV